MHLCALPFIPRLHIYVSSSLLSSLLTADPRASLKRRRREYLDIWREENGCMCPELSKAAEHPCGRPQGRDRFQRGLTQSQLPAWTTLSSSTRFNGAEVGSGARGMPGGGGLQRDFIKDPRTHVPAWGQILQDKNHPKWGCKSATKRSLWLEEKRKWRRDERNKLLADWCSPDPILH